MGKVSFEVSVDLEAMLAEEQRVEKWCEVLAEDHQVEVDRDWSNWTEDEKWEFVCRTVAYLWMVSGDFSDFCSWA